MQDPSPETAASAGRNKQPLFKGLRSPVVHRGSIVVPLDGSPMADHALDIAAEIARWTGSALHLLHARDDASGGDATDFVAQLENRRECLEAIGLQASLEIVAEVPEQAIMRAANVRGSALICMSAHGRGGLKVRALGRVAAAVSSRADTPVLLVRQPSPSALAGLDHLLVALDGSERSERVLASVEWLATGTRASATLVHVLALAEAASAAETQSFEPGEAESLERLLLQRREYLQTVSERLEAKGILTQAEVLEKQPIHRAILGIAARSESDLIVLSALGAGALDALDASSEGLGRVATAMAQESELPILLVRGEV